MSLSQLLHVYGQAMVGQPFTQYKGGDSWGGLFPVENFVFQIDGEIYHIDFGGLRDLSHLCFGYHKNFFGAFGTSVPLVHPQWQWQPGIVALLLTISLFFPSAKAVLVALEAVLAPSDPSLG